MVPAEVRDSVPWHRRILEPWLNRFASWRDRTLADPAFQKLASDLPFTRPLARRRANALFDLCAGFVYSQILLACVRLSLFDLLADGPRPASWLAARMKLDEAAADRLLRAAAALELVERRGDAYGLGPLGAALRGNPGLAAMIEHHGLVYRDLADPVALLKGTAGETELMRYWRYGAGPDAAPDAREALDYSALMSGTQSFVQGDVLDAYDFGRHRVVLDVGGGDGTFLAALAGRWPGPRLMLFDLPAVAELAAGRFQRAGLSGRAVVVPGDFRVDPLPPGADAVSLVRILHDHGDDTVATLLGAVHAALAPGGRVIVAEPMADAPGHPRVGDAYFGFYLMAMGRGRPRSAARLIGMLGEAGFANARVVRTRRPMLTSMIVAERGHS